MDNRNADFTAAEPKAAFTNSRFERGQEPIILPDRLALPAATITSLDRRAGYRRIGAKYAAVPRQGFQDSSASLAVVEPLARIRRHDLCLDMRALRTGDVRLGNYYALLRVQNAYPARLRKIASAGMSTTSR